MFIRHLLWSSKTLAKTKKAWSRRHLLTQWVTTTQSTNKHKTTHAPDGTWAFVLFLCWRLKWWISASKNKRRISKIPVAPHHSVRGYVNCNINKNAGRWLLCFARNDNNARLYLFSCKALHSLAASFSRSRSSRGFPLRKTTFFDKNFAAIFPLPYPSLSP